MRPIAVIAVCTACGQPPIAEAPDATAPVPSAGLFASATAIDKTVGSVTVAIPPTKNGDKLVVILKGSGSGPSGAVRAGSTPLSLALGAMIPEGCEGWSWAWISKGLAEGIGDVVITVPPQTTVAGYVLTFSGLSASTYLHEAWHFNFTRGSTSAPIGPTLETAVGNVLVSALGKCDSTGALVPTSSFTALPSVDGMDVAYYVTTEAGPHAAEWISMHAEWVVASLVLQ